MQISYNWLKQYIQTDLSVEEIAEILTSIGLEVEGIEPFESIKGSLEGLVVGEILSKEKHENADRLSVTQVNLGEALGVKQIVCGAPNVAAGQTVIVAPVGTTVHPLEGEPFQIKSAKIRSVASEGMICAEDEIGLGKSHDGIFVFKEKITPGTLVNTLFEVAKDAVLSIGLTPNRSDAMSHIGVARDLAAALKTRGISFSFNKPSAEKPTISATKKLSVDIENTADCARYSCVQIDGITVAPSPTWLKNALNAIGVKSINNIVDITNFILHEYGQPLHAFDADKIDEGAIKVQRAKAGEKFIALDGAELKLTPENLLISDAKKHLCIAGVYGGKESGVSEETKNVVIECAYFNPITVRKSSQAVGIRTESAQKFEKEVDIENISTVLNRTISLITELCGGTVVSEIVDVYPEVKKRAEVTLRYARLNQLAGCEIPTQKVQDILENLEIEIVSQTLQELTLRIPTCKTDVHREIDVIEEILRIYGFDNIPMPQNVHSNLSFTQGKNVQRIIKTIADSLTAQGFYEIMTNAITQSVYYADNQQQDLVRLLNSMTTELDSMRSTMLFGGLESIAHNTARENKEVKFYEVGSVYSKQGEKYIQEKKLAFFISGKAIQPNWLEKERAASFYDIKSYTLSILQKMLLGVCTESTQKHPFLDTVLSIDYNGKSTAQLGEVPASILKKMDIKQAVFYAEIQLDALIHAVQNQKSKYTPISKFPSVRRDLALVLEENISFEQIKQTALRVKNIPLQEINLFDVYRGEHVARGNKSCAISVRFQDADKTLQDLEINFYTDKLLKAFEKELGAILRG